MGEFVPLYRAAARAGFGPRDLDDCELWEVAAMLGLGEFQDAPAGAKRDLIAERVKAAREGRPPPAETPQRLPAAIGSLGAVTRRANGS